MKGFDLHARTPPAWVGEVARDLGALLDDHAQCELKAAATVRSLKKHLPEAADILEAMAQEEDEHYAQVERRITARGGRVSAMARNPYTQALLAGAIPGRGDALLDRLLVAAIIEARSLERFLLLGEHLPDRELAAFFASLAPSERGHRALFLQLARRRPGGAEMAAKRLDELLAVEAECVRRAPLGPRVHSGWAGAAIEPRTNVEPSVE